MRNTTYVAVFLIISMLAFLQCAESSDFSFLRSLKLRNRGNSPESYGSGVNATDDSLVFSRKLEYCTINMGGVVCNMTNVDKTLIIPGGVPPFSVLEIEVHNASSIVLYPICLPWVQVYGVRHLRTAPTIGTEFGCKTWLRAYESRISTLEHGLKDVSLVNSTADIIDLLDLRDFFAIASNISVIKNLEWTSYTGLIVETRINIIEYLNSKNDVKMDHVTVNEIRRSGLHFSGTSMEINNTHIGLIEKFGFEILQGKAVIRDTVFDTIAEDGIYVNWRGSVTMVNVAIGKCFKPCIVIPNESNASFQNTTVDGEDISTVEGAVSYIDEDVANFRHLNGEQNSRCNKIAEKDLECDFSGIKLASYFTTEDNETLNNLKLLNAEAFHIRTLCSKNIDIKNSSGIYSREYLLTLSHNSQRCPLNDTNLTAVNSTFVWISSRSFNKLQLTHCRVADIFVDKAKEVNFENVTATIRNLEIFNTTHWKNVQFNVTAYFHGDASVEESKLILKSLSVTKLASVLIRNSSLHFGDKSLTAHGSITLEDVGISLSLDASVHITLLESASLSLKNVKWKTHNKPLIIVVENETQVRVEETTDFNSSMLQLIVQDNGGSSNGNVSIVSVNNKWCDHLVHSILTANVPGGIIQCNFTNANVAEVLVNRTEKDIWTGAQIIGAKTVNFGSYCGSTIILQNVGMANMSRFSPFCQTTVYGHNTKFDQIRDVAVENLYNCTVESSKSSFSFATLMSASQMVLNQTIVNNVNTIKTFLEVFKSEVKTFVIKFASIVQIEDSIFKEHSEISISDKGTIKNSYFNRAIFNVRPNATLHLTNVTISKLMENGIILFPRATLIMENVNIIEGSIFYILHDSSTKIVFINSTMNGTLLRSTIGVYTNKPSTTTSSSTSTTVKPAPTTLSRTTTVINKVSEKPQTSTEFSERKAPDSSEAATGGSHWPGAGSIVTLFIVLIIGVVCSVYFVKYHRQRGTPILHQVQQRIRNWTSRGSDVPTSPNAFDLDSNTTYSRLESL